MRVLPLKRRLKTTSRTKLWYYLVEKPRKFKIKYVEHIDYI